eukprot:m.116198 g.116198  ORF g.116198 m.116198 type:complete len:55 (+) comp14226_c0_seq2:3284-3448(+)
MLYPTIFSSFAYAVCLLPCLVPCQNITTFVLEIKCVVHSERKETLDANVIAWGM